MIRRAPLLRAFGALVASLITAAPAAAHMTTAPVIAVPAAAPPPAVFAVTASGFSLAWIGLGLLAVALAFGGRLPRRAVAFLLALVLGIFAFEAGVHSVHHLEDGHSATARCAIASATAHALDAIFESVTVGPVSLPQWLVGANDGCRVASISLRANSGRAPPALA
jgi:hypothetical protein